MGRYFQKARKHFIVVGGGVAGLFTAYFLSERGYKVTLLEKSQRLGGLAQAYRWNISGKSFYINYFYHHFFKKDRPLIRFLEQIGLTQNIRSVNVVNDYGDTAGTLRELSVLGILRALPFNRTVAKLTVGDLVNRGLLPKGGGLYRVVQNKFADYADDISLAWLWARLHARYDVSTALHSLIFKKERLLYLMPSLQVLTDRLETILHKRGVQILTKAGVSNIGELSQYTQSDTAGVIFTTPMSVTVKILTSVGDAVLGMHKDYLNAIAKIKYMGAVNYVFVVKTLQDAAWQKKEHYWKQLNSREYAAYKPFVVRVAEHVINPGLPYNVYYVGAYVLPEMLVEYNLDYARSLRAILPQYARDNILDVKVFKSPYAAIVPNREYIENIDLIQSFFVGDLVLKYHSYNRPIGLFVNNFAQIFPWDRGINYALTNTHRLISELENRGVI